MLSSCLVSAFLPQNGLGVSQNLRERARPHAAYPVINYPAYSPDFNPIESVEEGDKGGDASHALPPEFAFLQAEVDKALRHFTQTPHAITALMARYYELLGALAA